MASRSMARRTARVIVVGVQGLCFVHLFNEYIFEVRPCTGASMYPTLGLTGTYVLQSRLALLSPSSLTHGSLVTAISPLDPSHQILKRIIGKEGDTICVDPSNERGRREEYCRVPRGHLWLAGDNTSNSTDSRDYGPVPVGLVKGAVVARVWPNPKWLGSNYRSHIQA